MSEVITGSEGKNNKSSATKSSVTKNTDLISTLAAQAQEQVNSGGITAKKSQELGSSNIDDLLNGTGVSRDNGGTGITGNVGKSSGGAATESAALPKDFTDLVLDLYNKGQTGSDKNLPADQKLSSGLMKTVLDGYNKDKTIKTEQDLHSHGLALIDNTLHYLGNSASAEMLKAASEAYKEAGKPAAEHDAHIAALKTELLNNKDLVEKMVATVEGAKENNKDEGKKTKSDEGKKDNDDTHKSSETSQSNEDKIYSGQAVDQKNVWAGAKQWLKDNGPMVKKMLKSGAQIGGAMLVSSMVSEVLGEKAGGMLSPIFSAYVMSKVTGVDVKQALMMTYGFGAISSMFGGAGKTAAAAPAAGAGVSM